MLPREAIRTHEDFHLIKIYIMDYFPTYIQKTLLNYFQIVD
jgi:hypothetical protein